MLLLVVLIDAVRPRPLVRRIVSGVLATERGMINNVLVEIDTKQWKTKWTPQKRVKEQRITVEYIVDDMYSQTRKDKGNKGKKKTKEDGKKKEYRKIR